MQDKLNAFDKSKADKQRKAYTGSLIMLFVLAVCIILAIFAWFTTNSRIAKIKNISAYSVDDYDIRYNTYEGTVQSNNKVTYDRTVDWNSDFENLGQPIPEVNIFPGERKYFMTIISNYDKREVNITGDLCLENLLINKELVTTSDKIFVNFGSQLEGTDVQQSFDLGSTSYAHSNVYSRIGLQTIYSGLTLPAASVDDGAVTPTSVTLYWYVTLNGAMVDNTYMNQDFLQFRSFRLKVTSTNASS